MVDFGDIAGNFLLFCLVFGMSATVDIQDLLKQLTNYKALLTGAFLQFFILPFLGFLVVKVLNLSGPMGITLLVVTSSPGGSYSNWWCSMFNADLALSVSMTAISTFLSMVMLPLNLLLYAKYSFDADVVHSLNWGSLFTALVVVMLAITLGLMASSKINSSNFNRFANIIGNYAGIILVIFSTIMSSSDEDSQLWERPLNFYLGVASPCVFGLVIANLLTTSLKLKKPERVTVSVECCYQNVGIATSVALTMFNGDDLSEALGVPVFYGAVEAFILGIYCIIAWKMGWTKAPVDASFWQIISTSYEVEQAEKDYAESIEVSLRGSSEQKPKDGGLEGDKVWGTSILSWCIAPSMSTDDISSNNEGIIQKTTRESSYRPPSEQTSTEHNKQKDASIV